MNTDSTVRLVNSFTSMAATLLTRKAVPLCSLLREPTWAVSLETLVMMRACFVLQKSVPIQFGLKGRRFQLFVPAERSHSRNQFGDQHNGQRPTQSGNEVDIYRVNLTAGVPYHVKTTKTPTGNEGDVVYVYDPLGNQVTGTTLESPIEFVPTQTGLYSIVVAGTDNTATDYSIRVNTRSQG